MGRAVRDTSYSKSSQKLVVKTVDCPDLCEACSPSLVLYLSIYVQKLNLRVKA